MTLAEGMTAADGRSRRKALRLSGLATLALFIVLAVLDRRMTDAGGPGIVGFEIAGSAHRAAEILADWGKSGRDAARLSLWLDFGFIAAYMTLLTLAVRSARDRVERGSGSGNGNGRARLAAIGGVAAVLPFINGGCDAIENVFLLLVLGGHGGSDAPLLATVFASIKFVSLVAILAFLLAAALSRRAAISRAGRA
ncbi:MAG: hypothetical protein QOJ38_204 [Solirubrobacterales bacterium]|jgi:hypothetical protein|nr:hypothetical protein [Solirubrobacterales bacterium]